ncbi:hypothetical protein E7T06_08625 [Deinococcus sp. Arct2-2]|uniref:hypothetical protein n=1 Tax=Deinococcus sp. Arct2-2 TaxID=2568653 RepID=UPI0010A37788|nr:hypothetical protein [Deinococcus sp. Arct2-2]THF70107.1 hypothetical protein E7T06_08625 [Deinococcus sp. Arct2-2]
MTDRSNDSDDQANTSNGNTGDMNADAESLSSEEAQQMGARAGRGARSEPGAHASDEYIEEHVQEGNDQPAGNSEISRSS